MAPIATRPVATCALALLVASSTCAVALVLGGGAPRVLPDTMLDAGPVVGWTLQLTRVVGWSAAALTVGSLLVAAVLGTTSASVRSGLRTSRHAASVWAVSSVAAHGLGTSSVVGVAPWSLTASQLGESWRTEVGVAHLVCASLATVVAAASAPSGSPHRARLLLAVASVAVLPVPLAGHVGSAADGGTSASGLVVHVLASLWWVGGLAGVVIHLRADREALSAAVPRYSAVALGAFVALVGSGVLAASAALPFTGPGWEASWSSGYAGVLAVKAGLLVLLGLMGLAHRRRTLPLVRAGRPRAFVRLAVGELVVMAAASGVAVALARTPTPPPPPGHAATSAVDPLSPSTLLLLARPNAVVLLLLALAVAAYLRTARRAVDAGTVWPGRRTAWFVGGTALAAALLCSGVATYASVLLSVHLGQLLTMLLVVPAMLLLGRPAELARAAGPRAPAWVARPAREVVAPDRATAGAAATCGALILVYCTPLLGLTLRSPWLHLLVLALALACGLALVAPLRRAAGPAAAGGGAEIAWLVPVAACLGVLALRLGAADQLAAAAWFLELRLGWADPLLDQRLAGGLAALAATLVLTCAAVLAWSPRYGRRRPASAPRRVRVATPRPAAVPRAR